MEYENEGEIVEVKRNDITEDLTIAEAKEKLYAAATHLVDDMIRSFIDNDVERIVLGWFAFKAADNSKTVIHTPTKRIKDIISMVLSCEISFDIESLSITVFKGAPMFMQVGVHNLSKETKQYLSQVLSSDIAFFDCVEKDTPGTTRYQGFKFLPVIKNSNLRNRMLLCLMRFMNRDDVRRNMDGTPNQVILISIIEEIMRCYEEFIKQHKRDEWRENNMTHLNNLMHMYKEITQISNDEIGISEINMGQQL